MAKAATPRGCRQSDKLPEMNRKSGIAKAVTTRGSRQSDKLPKTNSTPTGGRRATSHLSSRDARRFAKHIAVGYWKIELIEFSNHFNSRLYGHRLGQSGRIGPNWKIEVTLNHVHVFWLPP